jgi:hypothetical protein
MMRHRMLHEKLDATKAPLKLYKLMHHLRCVIVNVSLYPCILMITTMNNKERQRTDSEKVNINTR